MHTLKPTTRKKYSSLSGALPQKSLCIVRNCSKNLGKTPTNTLWIDSIFSLFYYNKVCSWERHHLPLQIRVLHRYLPALPQSNYVEEELKYLSLLTLMVNFIIRIIFLLLQLTAVSLLHFIRSSVWASLYPARKERAFLKHHVQTSWNDLAAT